MVAEKTKQFIQEAIEALAAHYGEAFEERDDPYPPLPHCAHLRSKNHIILLTASFITDYSDKGNIEGHDVNISHRVKVAIKDKLGEKALKLDIDTESDSVGNIIKLNFLALPILD